MKDESISCFIVDDDRKSIDLIVAELSKIPGVVVQATFTDPYKALARVAIDKPDLLLLDIEMPKLNGIELLQLLPEPRPEVIILTGHPEFAVLGYEYCIADYVLKPLSFGRLLKAVGHVMKVLGRSFVPVPELADDMLAVRVQGGNIVVLRTNEINYLRAEGDETMISLVGGCNFGEPDKKWPASKVLRSTMGLGEIAERLSIKYFYQAHRSHIVALNRIQRLDRTKGLVELSIPQGLKLSIASANIPRLVTILKL